MIPKRLIVFACVGLFCLGVQLTILYVLEQVWPALLANATGFVVSAQLNFALSYRLTWADSMRKVGRQLFATWSSFNANVLIGLFVNSASFSLAYHVIGMPSLASAAMASATSTISTFLVNHYMVFRPQRGMS